VKKPHANQVSEAGHLELIYLLNHKPLDVNGLPSPVVLVDAKDLCSKLYKGNFSFNYLFPCPQIQDIPNDIIYISISDICAHIAAQGNAFSLQLSLLELVASQLFVDSVTHHKERSCIIMHKCIIASQLSYMLQSFKMDLILHLS
jgi:hypothetical protein